MFLWWMSIRKLIYIQSGATSSANASLASRAFLKLHSVVELDTFTLTHGPFTPLDTPGKYLIYLLL